MTLTNEQRERYSRHLMLDEVGEAGQDKLLAARVLVVGAGGLGSPAAFYLAAAGVGTIGLVDDDRVALSNLQRQILHATPDLGRPKVESAAEKLLDLNPDIRVIPHPVRLAAANAAALLEPYDVVLDCADNFPTKFLIADACHFGGKPYVHAGALRFDGQVMTVRPGQSACYRCVFTQTPPPADALACSRAGILGVLPGFLGTLQATEALKLIMGIGDLLTDQLLVCNALRAGFRKVPLKRNPACPLCGRHPTIRALADS
jgi:molybdopterin/thiamine biosynthesis adenylyltransferase